MEKGRPEMKGMLVKFVSQITHSINQVKGTRSIKIPTNIEPNDEVAIANKDLIEEYEGYLVNTQPFQFKTIFSLPPIGPRFSKIPIKLNPLLATMERQNRPDTRARAKQQQSQRAWLRAGRDRILAVKIRSAIHALPRTDQA
jgi:hypothetical protein